MKTGFWYYLRILWNQDGVSQKFLSDMTNVAENTTASIINSMVEEGLVTRKRDKDDRRRFCITLTQRGRDLEDEVIHYAAKINRAAYSGIDEAEIEQCLSVLRRMSENLESEFESLQAAGKAAG